jgi:hypothetical protein
MRFGLISGTEGNAQGRFALAVRRHIEVILKCNMYRLLVCRPRHESECARIVLTNIALGT